MAKTQAAAPTGRPPAPRVTRRLRLPGGRTLTIRPVRPGDTAGLVTLYAGLGEDDVYRRFFSGHPPPPSFVERMTRVRRRGGCGVVAVLAGEQQAGAGAGAQAGGEQAGAEGRIVAEASYELLPDGGGELGITVDHTVRGWLGPYLLDVLVGQAAARGVSDLRADVLVENRRMLATLRARGYAVLGHDELPAVLRLSIGTAGRVPPWPGPHDKRRLLVEAPGGRWHLEEEARQVGFVVVACPGPRRGWPHCPAEHGEPCPLVAGADLVVDAVPGDPGQALLEHHRRLHPSVPVCLEVPPPAPVPTPPAGVAPPPALGGRRPAAAGSGGGRPATAGPPTVGPPAVGPGEAVPVLPRAPDVVVMRLLQRLAGPVPVTD